MNTEREKLNRLLRMFPVKIVNQCFAKEKLKQEQLLNQVIKENDENTIIAFVFDNIYYTKQHVYIFEHNIKDLKQLPNDILSGYNQQYIERNSGYIRYSFLSSLVYNLVLTDPAEEMQIHYYWPFCVRVEPKKIVVNFTMIERHASSHMQGGRKVYTKGKSIDERSINLSIEENFAQYGNMETCDLHKGIKGLWEADVVDAVSVNWRKSRAIINENMEEDYTLKQQYPEDYEQITSSPIERIVITFLQDKEDYPAHFTAYPLLGKLSFTTYQKEQEHTENVIGKILELN